jgi:hypothetical protein
LSRIAALIISRIIELFNGKFRTPHLRYGIERWVMPRLGKEPLAIKNLAEDAWPTVASLTSGQTYTDQIECVEWEPTRNSDASELLEDYARKSTPLVLKGYASSSMGEAWTLEWLKQEAGSCVVEVRVGSYASAPGDPESVLMSLADFVDYLSERLPFPHRHRLVEGMGPYLANMPISVLDKYLPSSRFLGENYTTNYWLGAADSQTPLHCHQHGDFLVTQLLGRRSFCLIPPHEALLLGYMPVNMNICTAAFDPFGPDCERFPGSDQIHKLRCDLEPGDALLLPGFWFHAVQITEPSMSATRTRSSMPSAVGGGPVDPWRTRAFARGW